jgi:hypothetical protein
MGENGRYLRSGMVGWGRIFSKGRASVKPRTGVSRSVAENECECAMQVRCALEEMASGDIDIVRRAGHGLQSKQELEMLERLSRLNSAAAERRCQPR